MTIQIIIADDHAIMREGLKVLLEKKGLQVPGVAENGREAVDFAVKFRPDIVMMDVSMPDMNGDEATERILKEAPGTKVLALSMHSSRRYVDRMFVSGASGYVLKNCAFEELYDAILQVHKGNFYISPAIARTFVENYTKAFDGNRKLPYGKFTKKEREVLQLIAEGGKTREIAEKMFVSVKTVETHRRNIMKKLNIHTVAGLTRFAIKEGIISLE
ncbi:MAG: response regulator transcription factor [Desulfobacteraceae bacterium]|nr:response regulator transcription factor [Desulfobacteraceae bacterium]